MQLHREIPFYEWSDSSSSHPIVVGIEGRDAKPYYSERTPLSFHVDTIETRDCGIFEVNSEFLKEEGMELFYSHYRITV